MSYSINGLKANSRRGVEPDVHLVLKNLKLKILGQPHDEVLLTTDKRFKHSEAHEDLIILKGGLVFRKYCGAIGNIKDHQILIPERFVDEVLRSLHGEFSKHPGITRTIIASRQKFYYPNMAQLIRQWVISCEQRIRDSRISDRLRQPTLQNPSKHITAPEDAMQIGLVPELPPSGGYENVVTAMDMFPRYLFVSLLSAKIRKRSQKS